MKILHAPTNVGSNPSGIVAAERKLGLDSNQIVINPEKITAQTSDVLWQPGDNFVSKLFKQFRLILKAGNEFDLIHFNGGKSIACLPIPNTEDASWSLGAILRAVYRVYALWLQRFELAYLRKRVPIFVTFQGSDARLQSYCLRHYEVSHYHEPELKFHKHTERHITGQIRVLGEVAEKIYALNPDLLSVLPHKAEFLPYASVDYREFVVTLPKNRPVKFIHAPSNRHVKGTKYILEAVDQLTARGHDFDFELIENMPRNEALEAYASADVVIDQLLVGWYGGLAVEAMAMGKPVISYIRCKDLWRIPEGMKRELPIVNATPKTIANVMKSVIEMDFDDICFLGRQSRNYVENWHDPIKIAERLRGEYALAHKGRSQPFS